MVIWLLVLVVVAGGQGKVSFQLGHAGQAGLSINKALEAAALAILKEDDLIDKEFDGFVRKLITYMMEDPRTISASLDLLFLAKAIERIGDHSKNVAELVIYLVKGKDVRHTTMRMKSCTPVMRSMGRL